MKETENYQQLLDRFTKRTAQLECEQAELDSAYQEWVKIDEQLNYLRGCKETIEYLTSGKLPNDGNHDGMRHHKPRHSKLDALD
jgi:hypothetical protein|tara:strand:- start:549 stop:800 length:252 start_codon:yes stop_codon:yes gene_type:complete